MSNTNVDIDYMVKVIDYLTIDKGIKILHVWKTQLVEV